MRIRTLFFASYRDLLGASEFVLDVPEGATVREAVDLVRARPGAHVLPDEPAVALNETYTRLDEPLSDGDELAFIPPVAGG